MRKVVVFGAGQMADIITYYLDESDDFQVVAFTLDANWMTSEVYSGRPVVPFHEVARHFPPETHGMFIAVGYNEANQDRARKYLEAKSLGYELPSYIHPSCVIHNGAHIGDHVIMFENNVVQPGASIGDNCRIWANNYITRGAQVGDHVYMSSSIVLAGSVVVEDHCFLGARAVVTPKVRIGRFSSITAGCTITRDVPEESVMVAPQPVRLPVSSKRWFVGANHRRDLPDRLPFGRRDAVDDQGETG